MNQIGSPPPTRGTLLIMLIWWKGYRITPAYAGNISFVLTSFS